MNSDVSGLYKGAFVSSEKKAKSDKLELRVDIDGERSLKVVSGDIYSYSGKNREYFGSFIFEGVNIVTEDDKITITGTSGKFSCAPSNYSQIRVTIPSSASASSLKATVEWLDSSGTSSGDNPTCVCKFKSPYFRSVRLEHDREEGVPPFSDYDTRRLPCGGAARELNLEKAYSEAGIDVIKLSKAPKPIVPDGYGGSDPDAKWSDSELHAAMVEHFSSWKNQPGWNVWLFSAKDYEIPQTYGMMFDEIGRHRQGCAVFYDSMNGSGAFETRLQLYACVHELGHCFNLLHSFQKSRAIPPAGADSSSSLSWMNYPRRYPSGEDGFWEDFPFQFTDSELIHLRHGLRDDVIFGGNDFSVGAALSGSDVSEFDAPSVDRSELRLRLESVKASFAFGEPVVVEIKLTNIGKTIKTVYDGTCLHPKMGLVQIAIRDPNGHIRIWKPLFEHLFSPRLKAIDKEHPFYQSAFIGYGREGFYFNQPGMYQIRAQYSLNDGVNIVSNIQTIRVRYPHNDDEEEAADLLLGQEQGVLLYLKGSDPPILKKGHKALNRLMQQYPRNPLTVYAKFITGFNQGRTFKKITADHKIIPRKPNLKVAERLLGSVIQLSEEGKGLDNISLNQTMVRLAKAQKSKGKENEAKKTMDHMMEFFGKKKFKHSIMETIEMQAKQALA